MTCVAVIPARYASTRFPGKPLASDTGKYLIQHVYESVAACRRVDRVIVATDDNRIVEAVRSFGGEVLGTVRHPAKFRDGVLLKFLGFPWGRPVDGSSLGAVLPRNWARESSQGDDRVRV